MNASCRSAIAVFFLLTITTTHALTGRGGYLRFINQFLAPQNAARYAVRMRPLVWDEKLARYARWYANQRRNDCALRHSNGPYGENIFWGSGDDWSPAQAVAAWVLERKWYNYWSNSCAGGEECGHYTQIVWGSTKRMGCARVTCTGGRGVFIICNYDPPGNYERITFTCNRPDFVFCGNEWNRSPLYLYHIISRKGPTRRHNKA